MVIIIKISICSTRKQNFFIFVEIKLDHIELKSMQVFLKSNLSINVNLKQQQISLSCNMIYMECSFVLANGPIVSFHCLFILEN